MNNVSIYLEANPNPNSLKFVANKMLLGGEGSVVIQKIKEGKGDYGYNAANDTFESMFKAGIIDPTKVSRLALENAASIAGLLITTECVVVDEPETDAPVAPAMPPGGGMG